MRILLIWLLIWLLCAAALPAFALCPAATIEPIPESNSVLVTMGPFTAEDGVTPVTPTLVTYRIDMRSGGGVQPTAVPLWAPATAVPTSPTLQVIVPASAFVVRDRGKSWEEHTFDYVWTWGSGHQGECTYVFKVQRKQFGP